MSASYEVQNQIPNPKSFAPPPAAVGPLNGPLTPNLPGLSEFPGTIFHSNKWNHSYDLSNKRVAVVGTGASAVQLIPKIQPKVGQLFVFQRSAGWVVPKTNGRYSSWVLRVLKAVPLLLWINRVYLYLQLELFRVFLVKDKKRSKVKSKVGRGTTVVMGLCKWQPCHVAIARSRVCLMIIAM